MLVTILKNLRLRDVVGAVPMGMILHIACHGSGRGCPVLACFVHSLDCCSDTKSARIVPQSGRRGGEAAPEYLFLVLRPGEAGAQHQKTKVINGVGMSVFEARQRVA